MKMRSLLIAILIVCWPIVALATEQINNFDVNIVVQKSGDIIVTEAITITAEGNQIRRGIYRDLPRFMDYDGAKLPVNYDIRGVSRDGRNEPHELSRDGNAFRIRIGDANTFISHGEHIYVIEYLVKNQIRYFENFDELYWNVTGNYWNFPIAKARATIHLPEGARIGDVAGYTGALGEGANDYSYSQQTGTHVFETTSPLALREGLTVAIGFEKGVVDPPSAADLRAQWWQRNASMISLGGAFSLIALFYAFAFNRVGRDPLKGPVFARYEPPEGYSPAAVHYVYHRHLASHQALIATLMQFAINKRLRIDVKDKKKTDLTLLKADQVRRDAPAMEENLLRGVMNGRNVLSLGKKYDSAFTSAYEKFQKVLKQEYGASHFKWNTLYLIPGIVLSVVAIIIAANFAVDWTIAHTAMIGVLVVLSAAFSYFIPAPTVHGQKIRTEIEGFRLYLKTAEKLQLDSVTPGSDQPPPMSITRYEKILPYAVALGVEEPWTKHFEKMVPETAQHYRPGWTNMSSGSYGSLSGLNSALMSSMSSGVTSALPQSSSSSGSGGGGFSGGGGGGGGGGGW